MRQITDNMYMLTVKNSVLAGDIECSFRCTQASSCHAKTKMLLAVVACASLVGHYTPR